mmetsp:Transcript_20864/g.28990  ORF Transcript_20864/g.28990 Transcript_20864/m.28990 type:complete len:260 (-) Transcript_20864:51-830(-)
MVHENNDTRDLETKIEKVREELDAIRSVRKLNETKNQRELIASTRKLDRTKTSLNELLEVGKHGHSSIQPYADSLKRMHEGTGEVVVPSYVLNLEARLVRCLHHMGNLHMQKTRAVKQAAESQKEFHKRIATVTEEGSTVEMQLINSILKQENEMAEMQEKYLDRISHEHWVAPDDKSLKVSIEQKLFEHEKIQEKEELSVSRGVCSKAQNDVKHAQEQIEKTVNNIVSAIKGNKLNKQNSQRLPSATFHPPQVRAQAC